MQGRLFLQWRTFLGMGGEKNLRRIRSLKGNERLSMLGISIITHGKKVNLSGNL